MSARRWSIACAATVLCLVLGGTIGARAHAIIIRSEPADGAAVPAPHELVLHFNSRIERELRTVTIVGADGRNIQLLHGAAGAAPGTLVYPMPSLAPGAYHARWKVLSADGHVTEGSIGFSINAGSSP